MRKPGPISDPDGVERTSSQAKLQDEITGIRNLVIKSENQVKSLTQEVKAIGHRNDRARWIRYLNTAVAYVLFVALVIIGAYMYVHAKLEGADNRAALSKEKEESYKREAAKLRVELGRWKQTERELLQLDSLIKRGEKEAAVRRFESLEKLEFSGLIEPLVARFQVEVAEEKYRRGLQLYKDRTYDSADAQFTKSLEYFEEPPYKGSLLYYQGMCAIGQKDYTRASQRLRASLDYKLDRSIIGNARYHLAFAFDRLKERRTARELYAKFLSYHKNHRHAPRARQRYERLKKK